MHRPSNHFLWYIFLQVIHLSLLVLASYYLIFYQLFQHLWFSYLNPMSKYQLHKLLHYVVYVIIQVCICLFDVQNYYILKWICYIIIPFDHWLLIHKLLYNCYSLRKNYYLLLKVSRLIDIYHDHFQTISTIHLLMCLYMIVFIVFYNFIFDFILFISHHFYQLREYIS